MPAVARLCLAVLLASTLPPGGALAGGAEDGNQGLQALDQGDYDGAIRLFTHAIKFGHLAPDDEEFAYANRGRAYLKKGDYSSAVADLDTARQMKPDDNDAQTDLIAALQFEIPADSIPDKPKQSFFKALGQALLQGFIDGLAQGTQQQQ
ncbi:MAG: tetratricopeptide repeat protein [Rhizomicrobium sp.]